MATMNLKCCPGGPPGRRSVALCMYMVIKIGSFEFALLLHIWAPAFYKHKCIKLMLKRVSVQCVIPVIKCDRRLLVLHLHALRKLSSVRQKDEECPPTVSCVGHLCVVPITDSPPKKLTSGHGVITVYRC